VKIQPQWVVTPGKQTNKHTALVSFMQVFGDRFQAESGWNILTLLGSGHQKHA
jgi:hypothetical protein